MPSLKNRIDEVIINKWGKSPTDRQLSRLGMVVRSLIPEEELKNATPFLGDDVPINERLYNIIHNNTKLTSCEFCLNPSLFSSINKGYTKYCSHACSVNATRGIPISSQSINKRKATLMERYGVEHNFQKGSALYETKQNTLQHLYGVDNPSQSAEIQRRKQQNIITKYNGVHFAATDKHKQLMMEKYGIINNSQLKLSKYALDRLSDPQWLKEQHHDKKQTLTSIASQLEVSTFCVSSNMTRNGVDIKKHPGESQPERDVIEFISQLGVKHETSFKVGNVEVDVYLPDYDLAIEIDGVYWHSDHHSRIDRNYHLNKTIECERNGVHLLHFFDIEVNSNFDIIKGMILSKMNINLDRIYARKCKVVELDGLAARDFLTHNHLQGPVNGSVRIGLEYNDELIAVAIFGKNRYSRNREYELLRLCSLNTVTIIGGASKLIKHFERTVSTSWLSYANRRFSNGNLYEQLGMKLESVSSPNYYYWTPRDNTIRLYSRVMFQKHKLKDKLNAFSPEKTEYENMLQNGYYRIWDCGNYVYVTQ